jgi:hypothetical protein
VTEKKEIELLRACVIVDRVLFQAVPEELPVGVLEAIKRNVAVKFEAFTVRTINSPMPEPFVDAQKANATAWSETLDEILDRRRGSATEKA